MQQGDVDEAMRLTMELERQRLEDAEDLSDDDRRTTGVALRQSSSLHTTGETGGQSTSTQRRTFLRQVLYDIRIGVITSLWLVKLSLAILRGSA